MKIGIVGMGLIGGSLALKLKSRHEVVGVDNHPDTVRYCREVGLARMTDISGLKGCEVVFVCVPLWAVAAVMDAVYEVVGESAVITDTASVKSVLAGRRGRVVGGHPMAGTENSGIQAARAHLFENAYYVLVPSLREADTALVAGLVGELGATAVYMTAAEHDRAVSTVSHLPHAVAYSLAATATGEALGVAGTGFMDTTRIASSDPRFWTTVVGMNRDNVLKDMEAFAARFAELKEMIASRDYAGVEAFFTAAKASRDGLKSRRRNRGYVLEVDVIDEVGAVGRIADKLAAANVNLTNIEIVNSREGARGALRLEIADEAGYRRAAEILSGEEK